MKLEKCPFCGSKPKLIQEYKPSGSEHLMYRVVCRNCGATQGCGFPRKFMIDKWNLRGKHD